MALSTKTSDNADLVYTDKDRRCVSCNKPKEYSRATGLCLHKCSAFHENAQMASHRAAYMTTPRDRKKTFAERLTAGFGLIEGKGFESTEHELMYYA